MLISVSIWNKTLLHLFFQTKHQNNIHEQQSFYRCTKCSTCTKSLVSTCTKCLVHQMGVGQRGRIFGCFFFSLLSDTVVVIFLVTGSECTPEFTDYNGEKLSPHCQQEPRKSKFAYLRIWNWFLVTWLPYVLSLWLGRRAGWQSPWINHKVNSL